MPELPDITIYLERLDALVRGQPLIDMRIVSPFVLRSVEPPKEQVIGRTVLGVRRMGKRIVFHLDDDYFCVLHLMIAGRLRWRKIGAAVPKRNGLVAFDFPNGTLLFTEASKKRRASLHLVLGNKDLQVFDRDGLEVLNASAQEFCTALQRDNHTLKRALTDPRILSGIGNAYSDEILHQARLSPFKQTQKLSRQELARLYSATQSTLARWIERLRGEVGDGFAEKVTRVSGRHGGTRSLPPAVSGLWRTGAAHRLCGDGVQLLRALSDRGQDAGGPFVIPFAQGKLAENIGRVGDGKHVILPVRRLLESRRP